MYIMHNAGFCKTANAMKDFRPVMMTLISFPRKKLFDPSLPMHLSKQGPFDPRCRDRNETNIHLTLKKRVAHKLMNYS